MPLQPTSRSLPQPILHEIGNKRRADSYSGWSAKMRRVMAFDNRNEFHHWLLLEGTPEVEQLCERYPEAALGRERHVFDMWVRWRDGIEECRDVVPDWEFVNERGYRLDPPRWAALASWGRQNGYHCRYITERELAVYTLRVHNWQRMLPFVRRAVEVPNEFLEGRVLKTVKQTNDIAMSRLMRALETVDPMEVTAAVAKLLHEGKLNADLDSCRFGETLLLSLPA